MLIQEICTKPNQDRNGKTTLSKRSDWWGNSVIAAHLVLRRTPVDTSHVTGNCWAAEVTAGKRQVPAMGAPLQGKAQAVPSFIDHFPSCIIIQFRGLLIHQLSVPHTLKRLCLKLQKTIPIYIRHSTEDSSFSTHRLLSP
ncbi:hypothetical protein FQN52_005338 [Onygenales sp. PD_12]|nr:hypothetical protein FQN52_005338 [Onygenales sp. PD_12]